MGFGKKMPYFFMMMFGVGFGRPTMVGRLREKEKRERESEKREVRSEKKGENHA